MSSPWIGIAILVPTLLGMLVGVKLLRAKFALHPEVSRKAMHVGLGLGVLSFPLLFAEVWPVLLIGGATVAVLAALRWLPCARERLGCVVHGVERRSAGDFYFPIAATGLFVLADGDPVLFGIPILTLALADAVAAIVGVRYGRTQYMGDRERKSLEGSAAFFTVAFLATHVPLLLFTSTGRLESLLIALIAGLALMVLEALCRRGTDNLLIPFAGYVLLDGLRQETALELVTALTVTLLLLALAAVLVLRLRQVARGAGAAGLVAPTMRGAQQ